METKRARGKCIANALVCQLCWTFLLWPRRSRERMRLLCLSTVYLFIYACIFPQTQFPSCVYGFSRYFAR